MKNTKIDWCDHSWNPVTGCNHGCKYCYARRIAERFAGGGYGKQADMFISKYKDDIFKPPYELKEPQLAKTKNGWYRKAPYPFGFEPTFHGYKLDEYKNAKPAKIFVSSMGDLFGDWVPDEWIEQIFEACRKAPQHTYLFLTKNSVRYKEQFINDAFKNNKNWWAGTSITGKDDFNRVVKLCSMKYRSFINKFVSIEPLLEDISGSIYHYAFNCVNWIILGAETGNRKDKVIPEHRWVDEIMLMATTYQIPLFMKDSLKEIWGEELIREFPKSMEVEK